MLWNDPWETVRYILQAESLQSAAAKLILYRSGYGYSEDTVVLFQLRIVLKWSNNNDIDRRLLKTFIKQNTCLLVTDSQMLYFSFITVNWTLDFGLLARQNKHIKGVALCSGNSDCNEPEMDIMKPEWLSLWFVMQLQHEVTFVVWSEMSQQLLSALTWNSVHTFMFLSGWKTWRFHNI